MSRYRLGIDIGGTFTDLHVMEEGTGRLYALKTPSTREDPSLAVANGIEELERRYGIAPADIAYFAHGTTLAVNTLLERNGARAGVLMTKGFTDTLELRRLRLSKANDFFVPKPVSLVPRRRVKPIDERMLADGIVELGSASAAVAAYLDRVADGFDTRGTGNGCAIAVVAAEAAPSEPALAEATSRALRLWTDGLTRQLVSEGHAEAQAHALATTAIAAIEGAILLGRGTGSSAPVREVRDVVATLLAAPPAAPGAAQAKTKARNTRKRTPPAK